MTHRPVTTKSARKSHRERTTAEKLSFDGTIDQLAKLANIVQPVGLLPARDRLASSIKHAIRNAHTTAGLISASQLKGNIRLATTAGKLIDALKSLSIQAHRLLDLLKEED